MKKILKKALKRVNEMAYRESVRSANQLCPFAHYQQVLPSKVDEMRRYKKYDK